MTATINWWGELMKASLDLYQTSIRANEMLAASGTVIASRMGSMAGAVRNPWGNDHVELARMVPEKVSAFSDAGQAVAQHCNDAFTQFSRHLSEVSSLIISGRLFSPAGLSQLSSGTTALATSVVTDTLKTSSVALAPIHKQATANARRLSAT